MGKHSTTILVIVGILLVTSAVSASLLVVMMSGGTVHEPQPYKGLPTTPRKMRTLEGQKSVDLYFKGKSSCWAVNNVYRVVIPDIVAEAEAAASKKGSSVVWALVSAVPKMDRAFGEALLKCKESDWVQFPNTSGKTYFTKEDAQKVIDDASKWWSKNL